MTIVPPTLPPARIGVVTIDGNGRLWRGGTSLTSPTTCVWWSSRQDQGRRGFTTRRVVWDDGRYDVTELGGVLAPVARFPRPAISPPGGAR